MHVWIGSRLCTNPSEALSTPPSPPPPPPPEAAHMHLTVLHAQRWRIWTLNGWGWEIWTWMVKSFQINVFYLLTWRCWKVKSLLMLVDGSVEKAYKKARVTNLPSTKRLKIKSCTWVGHLNTILVPLRVEFEPTKLQKFKCLGVAQLGRGGGGRLKLQIDRCIMLW